MYFLGTISGASGGYYNNVTGVSGVGAFSIPPHVKAFYLQPSHSGINFGLSPATTKKLDDLRIAAAYQNLNERIASIAGAMGRKVGDAVLDTVDFEGSGNYAGQGADMQSPKMMRAMSAESSQVAEPSFEPGESTLHMRLVGKVRFK